jgi:hypothetical protein
VVRNIALGAPFAIALVEVAKCCAKPGADFGNAVRLPQFEVRGGKRKHVIDRPLRDDEAAIHEELAERERRMENKLASSAAICKTNRKRTARSVANREP